MEVDEDEEIEYDVEEIVDSVRRKGWEGYTP